MGGKKDPDPKKYDMLNGIIWKTQMYSNPVFISLVIEFVQKRKYPKT